MVMNQHGANGTGMDDPIELNGANAKGDFLPDDLLDTARSLLDALEEEERCLKERDHDGLLHLVPTKESLARSLAARLRTLSGRPSDGRGFDRASLQELKEILRRIEARNERNRRFIQESLAIYQGILGLFENELYAPSPQVRAFPAIRGSSIHREA